MLAPESYFFLRSAASLSRAAPVTRLPFFRVSATRASSWEVRSGLLMITPRGRPSHPFGKVRTTSFVVLQRSRTNGIRNSKLVTPVTLRNLLTKGQVKPGVGAVHRAQVRKQM